jgi:hypothetical protein
MRLFSTTPTMVPLTSIFAGLIKSGHLGGLAADEGAIIFGAGFGKALDDFGEDVGFEFAGAEVIQKKRGSAPSTAMSLTQWLTRSWPMVS